MAEFQLRLEFSWLVREFSSFKVFGFSLPPKISCSVLDFCTSTVPQEMECIFFNFFRKCFSKEHRLFIIEFFYAQRCLNFELALVSYSPANLMAGRSNGLLVAKQYCIFWFWLLHVPEHRRVLFYFFLACGWAHWNHVLGILFIFLAFVFFQRAMCHIGDVFSQVSKSFSPFVQPNLQLFCTLTSLETRRKNRF